MNIELPQILIVFLSTPLSMRALLSLRRAYSFFLSAGDMKGFIYMLGIQISVFCVNLLGLWLHHTSE